ncbi:uncharacterized protein K452DRAFT_137437 [Aplosporella prunicola CBS 121167]|uniref:Uncharacterized protein n=1 Tax=Aplosporella prunicola CBS 121167 TaxID=1176127 RepID=A0A6A6BMB9_9PEZI|nr:uncharacterized protein K452DRAFT_137437 [Aplosporella prunicola CBS 121167]KAF2145280.1 hypothetical protein K452DRAFT_137437 [Aplosporella prunicola CBS 121167]
MATVRCDRSLLLPIKVPRQLRTDPPSSLPPPVLRKPILPPLAGSSPDCFRWGRRRPSRNSISKHSTVYVIQCLLAVARAPHQPFAPSNLSA